MTLFWEIQGLSENISLEASFTSEVYRLVEFGSKLKFTFDPWALSFTVEYLGQPKSELFPLNGYHAITFIVEDQSGQHPKQSFIRSYEPSFDGSNTSTLESQCIGGWKPFLNRYAQNGRVNVKIVVVRLIDLLTSEPRQFGTLMWKINNIGFIYQKLLSRFHYSWSESFYSSEKGYRMKVSLTFGDDGVHAQLHFLKGPWDKYLSKPSKYEIILRIVNQNYPNETCDITITSREQAFKICPDYRVCMKDDSLVIYCTFRLLAWYQR